MRDIEGHYALNRHKLAPDLIERIRNSYRRSQKYLETTAPVLSEDDIPSRIRKRMLLTVGYKQDDIDKLNLPVELRCYGSRSEPSLRRRITLRLLYV
jgi:hypothetical protein